MAKSSLKKRQITLDVSELYEAMESYLRREFKGFDPSNIEIFPRPEKITVDLEERSGSSFDPL